MNDQINILKGLHPGFFLARELSKRNLKKGSFALSIQEYPQTLGAITKGHRKMNIPLALKIERKLGLEEGFLMMMQVYHDIVEQKKDPHPLHPDLSRLRPALFWDTDMQKIDWHKQKRAVIQRVFERGNNLEKEEITRFYGPEIITSVRKTAHAETSL